MEAQPSRYHYMDHLRAHMMLLGVFYHVAPPYMRPRPEMPWIFNDPVSHPGLFVLMVMLHLFRMPVFFIVAGFFCALMIERRGICAMLEDRFKRITLVFVLLLWPLTILCSLIVQYGASITPPPPDRIISFSEITPSYLWFLYYLTFYYAIAAAFWWKLSIATKQTLIARIKATSLRKLFLVFCLIMAGLSWLLNEIFVPAPIQWWIDFRVFLYYLAFFVLGLALYRHPGMQFAPRNRLKKLLIATAVTTISCAVALPSRDLYVGWPDVVIETAWDIIFGIAAAVASMAVVTTYQRYFRRESSTGRYVAESAYWVYLAHFPLTLLLPVFAYELPIPQTLKFFIVCATTFALCLISYHFLVRSTWIGQWLNGKKKPRAGWGGQTGSPSITPLRSGE